jgi:dimethylamine corrinoid protein
MTRDFGEDLGELAKRIEFGDVTGSEELTDQLLRGGADWKEILNRALLKGVNRVREKFDSLEVFLPDLIFASDAVRAGIERIKASIPESEKGVFRKGVAVIGTVEGDIHDVGKTIVATLLSAYGFDVHDLGIDVNSDQFIERVRSLRADLLLLSCLMTTTLARQREVIEDLVRLGLREKVKVLVGGGAATPEWAKEIGADGYGADASEAVDLAVQLTSAV